MRTQSVPSTPTGSTQDGPQSQPSGNTPGFAPGNQPDVLPRGERLARPAVATSSAARHGDTSSLDPIQLSAVRRPTTTSLASMHVDTSSPDPLHLSAVRHRLIYERAPGFDSTGMMAINQFHRLASPPHVSMAVEEFRRTTATATAPKPVILYKWSQREFAKISKRTGDGRDRCQEILRPLATESRFYVFQQNVIKSAAWRVLVAQFGQHEIIFIGPIIEVGNVVPSFVTRKQFLRLIDGDIG
jgi:hypothetical protein